MEPFILREGPVAVRPLAPRTPPCFSPGCETPRCWRFTAAGTWPTHRRKSKRTSTPRGGARRCLVEFEGAPVGYIQIYQLDAQLCQEYHYPYQPGELLFGIDQFIGEPALWGKQIGRRFLALVLRRLTQEEGAAAVILDPHANNPGPCAATRPAASAR